MLEAYALIIHQMSQGTELATLLHSGEHMASAQRQLREFIGGLVAEAAKAGEIRDDTDPGELASYCLHALTAAAGWPPPARSAAASTSRWPGCAHQADPARRQP